MLLLPLKYKRRPPNIWKEWRLLLRVAILIASIRAGLQLLSYNRICALVRRTSRPSKDGKPLSLRRTASAYLGGALAE